MSKVADALRPSTSSPAVVRYGSALLMVAAATSAAAIADAWVHIPNLSLVFVLPVVVAAVSFGWGPALAAAAIGVICFNFFLLEPRHTLHVAEAASVWALGLLVVVAAIVSALAAHARRQALVATEHFQQSQALQGLAHALAAAADRTAIIRATVDAVNRLFQAPAVVLVMNADGAGDEIAAAPPSVILADADREAAAMALASRQRSCGEASPSDGPWFEFWPVVTPSRRQAVIGVLRGRSPGSPALEGLIEIVRGYLAVSLDREAYAREAADAKLEAQSERVKADLLAAVSHDLRTPLSTILVTLQSLRRFPDVLDEGARSELLALAEVETERLARLVGNLLDMSRIEAGAVAVQPEPVSPGVLVASALERAACGLAGGKVVNEVPVDLPTLLVDPVLTETALANVLENAAKYAPLGSVVTIRGHRERDTLVLEVLDEGPGFSGGTEAMFQKFTRGVAGDGRPPGLGLGLSIARGFLRAQGADVDATNRPDQRGGRVRLFLPLAETE